MTGMRQWIDFYWCIKVRDTEHMPAYAVTVHRARPADSFPQDRRNTGWSQFVFNFDQRVQQHWAAGHSINGVFVNALLTFIIGIPAIDLRASAPHADRHGGGLCNSCLLGSNRAIVSIHPRLRWTASLRHAGFECDRTVGELDRIFFGAGERMNHPVIIVTIRIIISGMRAAALGPSPGTVDRHLGLRQQIFKFERLDQVRVPDKGSISYSNFSKHPRSFVDLGDALAQDLFVSKNSAVCLHYALHRSGAAVLAGLKTN